MKQVHVHCERADLEVSCWVYTPLSLSLTAGTIPLSWSKLNLTKLDISSNQLTGGIQHFGAGGSWPSMTWVNASHNQFSGELHCNLYPVKGCHIHHSHLLDRMIGSWQWKCGPSV